MNENAIKDLHYKRYFKILSRLDKPLASAIWKNFQIISPVV